MTSCSFYFQTLLVHTSHGIRLVPELYAVGLNNVEAELASPGSQEYVATGRIPFMWAQSLYVISQLLKDSFIACGELDPINRRLSSLQRLPHFWLLMNRQHTYYIDRALYTVRPWRGLTLIPHELAPGFELCQMKGTHIGASELTLQWNFFKKWKKLLILPLHNKIFILNHFKNFLEYQIYHCAKNLPPET